MSDDIHYSNLNMGSSTARSLECLTFPEEFLLRLIKDMMKDLGAGAEGALSIATLYEAVDANCNCNC